MKAKRFTTLLVSGVLAASMLVGCGGINKNETVATLDGQEIKLGVANFAARLQQAEADDFYRAYFGDDVWSSDLYNNGTTMEDNTKNSVIEMIENLYILQNHMADYDVTLTDDETAKIAETAAQFMADNDDKAVNALGATEDIVKEYLTLVTVQSKMRAAIIADADTNVVMQMPTQVHIVMSMYRKPVIKMQTEIHRNIQMMRKQNLQIQFRNSMMQQQTRHLIQPQMSMDIR